MHSRRVTITTGDNREAVIIESANKQMDKSINYQVQRTVNLSVSFLACMPLWVPSFESHDSKAGSTVNVARQPSRDESSCTVTACGHDWGQTVHQDSGDALLVMELETALVRTTCVDSVLPTPLSISAPRCSAALTPSSWPSEFERPLTVERPAVCRHQQSRQTRMCRTLKRFLLGPLYLTQSHHGRSSRMKILGCA